MSTLRILKEAQEQIHEKDLQRAVELDLTVLEEGLQKIDTEVSIGTGRIDTLAVDQAGRPTFIGYKRPGNFDHNALIQLMDYLSWFLKDPAHLAELRERISPKLDDQKMKDEIRLILVVSDLSDRVKNACYVINCPVMIFSYSVSKLESGELAIGPKQLLDTSEGDSLPTNRPLPALETLVPAQFNRLWGELDAYLRGMPGVEVYNTRIDIRARSSKVFARMIFQKKYLILRLLIARGSINSLGSYSISRRTPISELSELHHQRRWMSK